MTVLVVGGTGFLGRQIVRALVSRGIPAVSLSRSGNAVAGEGYSGDVTAPELGLRPAQVAELREQVTHVVSCFGSVSWAMGPRESLSLHLGGVRNLLSFAARCERLERVVHVSSILALGRARGKVGNRELALDQSFRNWYEHAKHVSEAEVRACEDVPRRIVRFGPLLGLSDGRAPAADDGLLAVLPYLLRGYPAHLHSGGTFPIYLGEVGVAAEVVVRALEDDAHGPTWTWFDPSLPSVAEVLTRLCAAWHVVPRLVNVPGLRRIEGLLAPRLGLPRAVLDYTEPWVDLDSGVLDGLPPEIPACPPSYIEQTALALRGATLREQDWATA